MDTIKYVFQLSVDEFVEILKNNWREAFDEFITAVKSLLKNFDEILSLEDVCLILGRSKPSVEKYIKQGKIKVHHLEEKSPIFLKSELFECIKVLPSLMRLNPINQNLDFIKTRKDKPSLEVKKEIA